MFYRRRQQNRARRSVCMYRWTARRRARGGLFVCRVGDGAARPVNTRRERSDDRRIGPWSKWIHNETTDRTISRATIEGTDRSRIPALSARARVVYRFRSNVFFELVTE